MTGSVLGYTSDPMDPDSDNDGISDGQDLFTASPLDDQDGDGVPDSTDNDDDSDGVSDGSETYTGAYPSTAGGGTFRLYPDSDGEGVPEGADSDPDNPETWGPDTSAPAIAVVEPTGGALL